MKMGLGNMGGIKGLERAQDAQTITALEEQNAALLSQVELLKSQRNANDIGNLSLEEKTSYEQQIDELTEKLAANTGEYEIPIDLIDPDPEQPRKVFAVSVIRERANSLKKNGQLTAIIVTPQIDGRYKLFEGELRWRGKKELGDPTIRAVLLHDLPGRDPISTFREQVITSLHAQGLHELDLAEAIIKISVARCTELGGRGETVPKLLNSAIRRLERNKRLPDFNVLRLSEETEQVSWVLENLKNSGEQAVFQTILELQLNPNSVNTGAMRLIGLSSDLKNAIRDSALEAGKARELNRLSAKNLDKSEKQALSIRQKMTTQVIEQRLSILDVKILVDKLLKQAKGITEEDSQGKKILQQLNRIVLDDLSIEELALIQEALEEKIEGIKRMLNDHF
jgi:ParB family chromosome partitioning protein